MAEGGVSLSSGSDIIFDYFCEFCIDDGRQLEAHGFCVDCGEYLCLSCYSGHKTTRFTKHHVLQDKTCMPKDSPLSQDRASKDIATKCKKHSGEPMKYYCTSHRALGCSTCFAEDHRGCQRIESIAKESETILDSPKYTNVMANLQTVKSKSRDVEKLARDNKAVSQKCCDEVVSSVQQQTEDAIKRLREHEKSIVTLAKQVKAEEEERMDSVLKECDVMSKKAEQLSSTFKSLQASKRVCQLYITMRETENEVSALQQTSHRLENTNVARTFKFQPNDDMTSRLLRSSDALGKITHETRRVEDVRPPSSASPNNVTVTKLAEIDTTSVGDTKYNWVSGSAIINNKLIITDCFNNKLKLIDTDTNKLIDTLDVATEPWDVAAINQHKVVVTLSGSKKIQVVKVTDTLEKEKVITVCGECRGVAYSQDRLLVTYRDNPRLEILDLHGAVLGTIAKGGDGRKLFEEPKYVCVSKDGKFIYVSDSASYSVLYLTFDGVVKAKYKDKYLRYPGKICTDHHGYVYVCGVDSRTVHMMTADCRKIKLILTSADGLDKCVWSISHCQNKNRLFIGMQTHIVQSYQLS